MLSRRDTCKDSKLTFSSNVFELKNNLGVGRSRSSRILMILFPQCNEFDPTLRMIVRRCNLAETWFWGAGEVISK